MGISACKGCNCNKNENENYNELNSKLNDEQNNIQTQENDNIDKSENLNNINPIPNMDHNYNWFENLLANDDNNYSKNQKEIKKEEIKLFIKKFNIKNISFPLEIDKLNNEGQIIHEKIQKILNKFYPCDDNQINQIEKNLINTLLKIKNMILKNIQEKNIIFNGNLKKLINLDINSYKNAKYSDRFCVLYTDVFKYYKSEVQFLKNLKPLSTIYLNQICRVNLVRGNKNTKKIDHIILCNKLGLQKNYIKNDNNESFINEEYLIVFTCNDEQIIYKWFVILQYLIYENKN